MMENILLEELQGENSTIVELLVESHDETSTDSCNQFVLPCEQNLQEDQQIAIEVNGENGVRYLYVLGSNVYDTPTVINASELINQGSSDINKKDLPLSSFDNNAITASKQTPDTTETVNKNVGHVSVISCGTMTDDDVLSLEAGENKSVKEKLPFTGNNADNTLTRKYKLDKIQKLVISPQKVNDDDCLQLKEKQTKKDMEILNYTAPEIVCEDSAQQKSLSQESNTKDMDKLNKEHTEGEVTIMNEMKLVPVKKRAELLSAVCGKTGTIQDPNKNYVDKFIDDPKLHCSFNTETKETNKKVFALKNKSLSKQKKAKESKPSRSDQEIGFSFNDETCEQILANLQSKVVLKTTNTSDTKELRKYMPFYERPFTRNYRQKMECEKVSIRTNLHSCNTCNKSFSSEKKLKSHMKSHDTTEPYMCEICGKAFRVKETFENHKYTHKENGEKPFKCNVCGISFIKQHYLFRHSTCHTGIKPFKCDLCGVKFRTKGDLKRHERMHGEKPGVKQYKCKQCGKRYCAESGLIRHERAHKGEKPYECDVCSKSFSMPGDLKRHIKTHFGGDDFPCKICGKVLTSAVGFKRHQRMHSGEKPYECTQCGNCYIDLWSLMKHRKIHEKGKSVNVQKQFTLARTENTELSQETDKQ